MTRARDLSRAVNNKMSVFKYTATAGQTTFTGADGGGATLAYDPNSMIVTYNGIILESTSEYTATNGTSVVLAAGAEVGAEVNILAFEDVAYSGVMPTTGGTFTGAVTHSGTVAHTGDVTITGNANDANGNLKVTTNTPSNYPAVVIQTSTGGNGSETHGLHIKNTAAGHGLRVDDESSDNSPFVITSLGRVGIGLYTPLAPLHIEAADNSEIMNFTVTGNERWALRGESGSGSNDFLGLGIAGGVQAMYWNEGGAVQKPSQPGFDAYLSANSNHPSGTYNLSTGDSWSTRTNVGNHFSSGTFTAPVAGRYLFTANVTGNGGIGAMTYFGAEFQVNGVRRYVHWWGKGGSSGGYFAANNAATINLAANDIVRLASEKSHACTIVGGAAYTSFTGILIG